MGFLGEIPLTRRTWAAGAWSAGVFTRGASADTAIRGAFRPMGAKAVQLLEEADRSRDPRVLVTTTELQIAEAGSNLVSDHVSVNKVDWYEVIGLRDGTTGTAFTAGPGINGYTYDLLRVQEDDG